MSSIPKIDEKLVIEICNVLSHGIISGGGGDSSGPGQICVEEVISYAMGPEFYLADSDHPRCVDRGLCDLKIHLNDEFDWKHKLHRAEGLKRIAVAQLGTVKHFNEDKLVKYVDAWLQDMHRAMIIYMLDCKIPWSNLDFWQNGCHPLSAQYLQDLADNFSSYMDILAWVAKKEKHDIDIYAWQDAFIETLVQGLIAQKTKGSQFLHLVPERLVA